MSKFEVAVFIIGREKHETKTYPDTDPHKYCDELRKEIVCKYLDCLRLPNNILVFFDDNGCTNQRPVNDCLLKLAPKAELYGHVVVMQVDDDQNGVDITEDGLNSLSKWITKKPKTVIAMVKNQ